MTEEGKLWECVPLTLHYRWASPKWVMGTWCPYPFLAAWWHSPASSSASFSMACPSLSSSTSSQTTTPNWNPTSTPQTWRTGGKLGLPKGQQWRSHFVVELDTLHDGTANCLGLCKTQYLPDLPYIGNIYSIGLNKVMLTLKLLKTHAPSCLTRQICFSRGGNGTESGGRGFWAWKHFAM